jgi:hypothetical protein
VYDHAQAAALAELGVPAFACPDRFPIARRGPEGRDVCWANEHGLHRGPHPPDRQAGGASECGGRRCRCANNDRRSSHKCRTFEKYRTSVRSRPSRTDLEPTMRRGTGAAKALADPTRSAISIWCSNGRRPRPSYRGPRQAEGTVDHHLKVLERARPVRVVRAARCVPSPNFWSHGRTIRTSAPIEDEGARTYLSPPLRELQTPAAGCLEPATNPAPRRPRRARRGARRPARRWPRVRLRRRGDTVYGLLMAVYPIAADRRTRNERASGCRHRTPPTPAPPHRGRRRSGRTTARCSPPA